MSFEDPVLQDDRQRNRARIFAEFLTAEEQPFDYKENIAKMLREDETRLIVNIDDLRGYNREFSDGLLKEPSDFLPAFEEALKRLVL